MKIGIDARFALGKRRGIGTYSLNLIRSLSELDKRNEYFLYVDDNDNNGVLRVGHNFSTCVLRPSFYPMWEHVLLPRAAKRDGIRLLHCLGNTAPIFLPSNIRLLV